MNDSSKPFFVQALDALKNGDRRRAAAMLARQIRDGNTSVGNIKSVASLAVHIGETGLAIEASRPLNASGSLDSRLDYWALLATHGHPEEASAEIEKQPAALRDNPAVLHFRGTLATQFGRFAEAEELFRRALAKAAPPAAMQTWFALAMIKTFSAADPDIVAMEQLAQHDRAPGEAAVCLAYGIGKAWEDSGEADRAFAWYTKGATLRRHQHPFDAEAYGRAADDVMAGFTPDALRTLSPSGFRGARSLFVTGLPRSGTTLTEQMLRNHSAVTDGAELNLFAAALIPTRGFGVAQALAYQQHSGGPDPWGEIARDYGGLVDRRFGSPDLVIDKSLGQSLIIGQILHAMPETRIAWLRRNPEDVALSCFSTFFATGLPWSWSLTDIAAFMRIEDRLFDHWKALFPERILAVPYEELVSSPAVWAHRLQRHFGLPVEAGLESAPRLGAVTTASAGQVRQPISTARVGRAEVFERHMKPFRDLYFG